MGKGFRIPHRRKARWLIALLAVISVAGYLLTLPNCRTDRVILEDHTRGETHIELGTVSDTPGDQRLDILWDGVPGSGPAIEIPFVSPAEGHFRIEVRHEGREEPIVREFGTLRPHLNKLYYVIVGNEEILDFSESYRGFDTPDGKGSDVNFAFQSVKYFIGDTLSCLDGA